MCASSLGTPQILPRSPRHPWGSAMSRFARPSAARRRHARCGYIVCVENPNAREMPMRNHFGIDVESREDVDRWWCGMSLQGCPHLPTAIEQLNDRLGSWRKRCVYAVRSRSEGGPLAVSAVAITQTSIPCGVDGRRARLDHRGRLPWMRSEL